MTAYFPYTNSRKQRNKQKHLKTSKTFRVQNLTQRAREERYLVWNQMVAVE